MTKEEKELLKERFELLKNERKNLVNQLRLMPLDNSERYNFSCELMAVEMEIKRISKSLRDTHFRKNYLRHLMERLMLGNTEESRGR